MKDLPDIDPPEGRGVMVLILAVVFIVLYFAIKLII